MPKLQEMMTIVSQREVASNIFEMVLKGELVEEMDLPGQFLHLAVPNASMLYVAQSLFPVGIKSQKLVRFFIELGTKQVELMKFQNYNQVQKLM